ncbi:hypothetical protein FHU29_002609 [Hoyosella altamirensis]|uniref:Uncharacterized protein n=1 Tax=Hoyosella altamirensis TaxID=616997 RepID=A0A839RNT1_9ACTN|nr:hypothetical protein [Hoyosella altamirensis]
MGNGSKGGQLLPLSVAASLTDLVPRGTDRGEIDHCSPETTTLEHSSTVGLTEAGALGAARWWERHRAEA